MTFGIGPEFSQLATHTLGMSCAIAKLTMKPIAWLGAIVVVASSACSTRHPNSGDDDSNSGDASITGAGAACAAATGFADTSASLSAITLNWTNTPGVTATLERKTYCGIDDYAQVGTTADGVATYTDSLVQANWSYWYRLTTKAPGGGTAVLAIATSASDSGIASCAAGAAVQPSDAPATCDGGTGSGTGSFTPITNVTPGAQVVNPGDNIAAAVQGCSGKVIHFAPGTYTTNVTITLPSNCTLEGELGWTAIITGNANPIFELGDGGNQTITRLHFSNLIGTAINGGDRNGYVEGTHIYLNFFEHIATPGPQTMGNTGGNAAIFLFHPDNLLIERNAFDNGKGDSVHLISETGEGGGYTTKFPARNIMVRWNFTSNFNAGTGNPGFSSIEIQLSPSSLHVYQNVMYSVSPGEYGGSAMSIASGAVPCMGGGPGSFTGCLPPENGVNAVFIEGNIFLDNGILLSTPINWGGIETMGPTPLVQNNYLRGWSSGVYTGWMFHWNTSTNNYDLPSQEPVYFQKNTMCHVAAGNVTSVSGLVSTEDSGQPVVVGSGGNVYDTHCTNLAPPPLPPQIVVTPSLLDDIGGLNALTNSPIPGANTYWPNANANLNNSYQ